MLAAIKNYDLICYQLRNNLYSHIDNPLQKEIDELSKEIISILLLNEKIESLSIGILSKIFNLRIKAIKWLSQGDNFNYLEMLSEDYGRIEENADNKEMQILNENILFALRCNKRVVNNLFGETGQMEIHYAELARLPEINYQHFLSSLAFAIDNSTAQKIADWNNSSLQIEFVILAADIIRNEKLKISDKAINELSFLIADAAQEYSAIAMESGILKNKTARRFFSSQSFDKTFVDEQKALADMGIEDFNFNFTN